MFKVFVRAQGIYDYYFDFKDPEKFKTKEELEEER
jgi:hypothetical protein